MRYLKPVCPECGLEMNVAEVGVVVLELAFDPPVPYRSYNADRYKCPECGKEVISGYGKEQLLTPEDVKSMENDPHAPTQYRMYESVKSMRKYSKGR